MEKALKRNEQSKGHFYEKHIDNFLGDNNSYNEQKESKEMDFRTPKWENGEKEYL